MEYYALNTESYWMYIIIWMASDTKNDNNSIVLQYYLIQWTEKYNIITNTNTLQSFTLTSNKIIIKNHNNYNYRRCYKSFYSPVNLLNNSKYRLMYTIIFGSMSSIILSTVTGGVPSNLFQVSNPYAQAIVSSKWFS